jgi:hypothetical protein
MSQGRTSTSAARANVVMRRRPDCDETTALVLDPGRGHTKKGYFLALARDDHMQLTEKKNKVGQTRWTAAADTVDLIRVFPRQMPDHSIAAVLNRAGKATGKGNRWTGTRVGRFTTALSRRRTSRTGRSDAR